jgi:hypothetical protein
LNAARLVLGLALAALFAGCGGGDQPEDVLGETASRLGEIRSGTLDLSLLVTPRDRSGASGFELRGPFSFGNDGSLPVMKVEYTQVAAGERGSVVLISTGQKAYAAVGEETYELTPDQTEELRSATGALERDGGFEQLALDGWIVDPELSDGGEIDGAETDRVRGRLDIVEAVNGLLELARGFGRDLPRIDGESAKQLRKATRATRFELHTGKDDRLLRSLTMEADFALEVPAELRNELGDLVGGKVAFRLGIAKPNDPVRVVEPKGVRPASELPGA